MKVRISSPLHSYTNGVSIIDIDKPTLQEVIDELDIKFPGIKFRFIDEQDNIRKHMRVYVDGEAVDSISYPLQEKSEIFIVHLVSGG